MGVSTDAILAYGFDLGEEWQDMVPWGDVEDEDGYPIDFETWLADEAGVGYDTGATYEDREKVWEACPVEVIRHCSGDFPMVFLAVQGTELRARRGYPELLEELGPPPTYEQIEAFIAQVREWGIEFETIGWHLFSMWE